LFFSRPPLPPTSPLFPYTTLFRSARSPSLTDSCGCSPPCFVTDLVLTVSTPSANCWNRSSTSFARVGSSSRPAQSWAASSADSRSEEHTSELQSRFDLVCRLLLEK